MRAEKQCRKKVAAGKDQARVGEGLYWWTSAEGRHVRQVGEKVPSRQGGATSSEGLEIPAKDGQRSASRSKHFYLLEEAFIIVCEAAVTLFRMELVRGLAGLILTGIAQPLCVWFLCKCACTHTGTGQRKPLAACSSCESPWEAAKGNSDHVVFEIHRLLMTNLLIKMAISSGEPLDILFCFFMFCVCVL